MSARGEERKDQLPPPKEMEEEAMQAEAQAGGEIVDSQEGAMGIPPWDGYGRFKTVMGRRSKAEFAEAFYARQALESSYLLARHHLDTYKKCHDAHQRRRLSRNVRYYRCEPVTVGSWAYSLSKNQLEEANRGPNREVPDRSMNGDSTDYDLEGDEGMELVIASMPSLTALPMAPSYPQPPTDGGAGLSNFQLPRMAPDPFPSALGWPVVDWNAYFHKPLTHGAVQAEEVVQAPQEALPLDNEALELESMPLVREEPKAVALPPRAVRWPPYVDVVIPSTGLLMFSMDQMHAALDTHPQLFMSILEKEEKMKQEEEKKEDETHVGQIVVLDGQGKDADNKKGLDGDPSQPM